nr:retrovirus-related Pol polyprotein from transposon TNT 1-94 [Tanacetum cinerariifolium]
MVVKERTTATAITEGTWGFEHTKACFRDNIIPFVQSLKELFTSFYQWLIDEVIEVQNVFTQMELVIEQHCEEKSKVQTKMENVLQENDRLLTQALSVKIVNIVVHENMRSVCLNVTACARCVTIETELKMDFLNNECYDMFLQKYHTLEKHCITLEVNNKLNTELFQRDTWSSRESAPTFAELFEINNLKAQAQAKDTVILKLKEKLNSLNGDVKDRHVKRDVEESESLNIELDHKLNVNCNLQCVACNGCLFSDNHDSYVLDFINNVIAHVKSKSVKKTVKRKVWKPTGKVFTNIGYIWRPTGRTFTMVGNACPLTRITTTTNVPLRKPIALESNTPKPVVFQIVLWYLDSGCSKHMIGDRSQLTNFVNKFLGTVKFGNDHVEKIMGYDDYQIGNGTISRVYFVEGLGHNLFFVGQFCNSDLDISFRQHTYFICNLEGASKTKSWLWHRRLSHLNFGAINHLARKGLVWGLPKLKFKKDHLCFACAMGKSKNKSHKPKSEDTNQEKLYLLHMDLYGPMRIKSVNGNKIATPTIIPPREPIPIVNSTKKPVVTLVVQIILWYLDSDCSKHMTGDRSQLVNFVQKFLGTVKFGNDHVAKIMGYGDSQIGNVTISRVYYMEGLSHNLFSVGQFCDSDLEVAFRQHTCFICNLDGVDLLTGSRGNNLYTLSIQDMMASSPICLLSKASKTKSWLWHHRLSHLNFGAMNHLARQGLVRGLPKLKFEKGHLCSACAMGKSTRKTHKPKSEDTNQEKLYLLHMDLCGPMRVESVNGKKYILVIVDDYSRFTWVDDTTFRTLACKGYNQMLS